MNLVEKAAKYLDELVIISSKSNGVLLLVSGGSCLNVVNEMQTCWNEKVTIGVIDERYTTDFNISNFGQMKNMPFWNLVTRNKCRVINTEIRNGETLGAAAERMEKQWKNWKKHNRVGKIIVLLGMGVDGHTAGIMPMPEDKAKFKTLFGENSGWVCGYDCGDKNTYRYRMTATLSFLEKEPKEIVVFVTGKEKKEKWDEMENDSKNVWDLPIKVIKSIKNVTYFTDFE